MEQEKKVLTLNIDDVLPNRFQPRINFEEDKICDLSASIKEHGVIQPIVVRPIADKFEIIAGERRYKASVMAGKTSIPAIVVDLNDKDSAEVALIENVQRQDLTPIEEAISYKKILDMGYISQEGLAKKLGKSQAAVANKLRLLNLDDSVQEALLNGKISERHARSLLKLKGNNEQQQMLKRIISERMTVRKTDEEIKKMMDNFSTDDDQASGNVITKPVENKNILERLDFDIDFDEEEDTKMDSNNINPGFVDVNKIENNAQDIYKPKQEAPINEFLKPSDIAPTPEPIKQPEAPVTTGRFFSVLGGNSSEELLNDIQKPVEEETSNVQQEVLHQTSNQQNMPSQMASTQPSETIVSPASVSQTPDYSFMDNNAEKVDGFALQAVQNEANHSEMPVEPASVTTGAKNVGVAVNNIRACAEALRNIGYQVDLDEFDLENMYQVVFKVHKTDN